MRSTTQSSLRHSLTSAAQEDPLINQTKPSAPSNAILSLALHYPYCWLLKLVPHQARSTVTPAVCFHELFRYSVFFGCAVEEVYLNYITVVRFNPFDKFTTMQLSNNDEPRGEINYQPFAVFQQ